MRRRSRDIKRDLKAFRRVWIETKTTTIPVGGIPAWDYIERDEVVLHSRNADAERNAELAHQRAREAINETLFLNQKIVRGLADNEHRFSNLDVIRADAQVAIQKASDAYAIVRNIEDRLRSLEARG